ncbi:hypothetical protein RhiirB3_440723 [Rhizophagus irregularis]|nr:hypothetical protein RhiirB3_440723 [Rhizophagus irregularis]
MSKLSIDIFYLIFKEFLNDKKNLYSCLLINKTFCELIIPILWNNPWKFLKLGKENSLLYVITSHLSDESRNNLCRDIFNHSHEEVKKPLFDYISFCKHLNLGIIQNIIDAVWIKGEATNVKNKIFNLFINENMRISHLYIPYKFDIQIHHIPGAKSCFSEIEFLSCNTNIKDNIVTGLMETCKSIRKLELIIETGKNNYKIVELIKSIKKLYSINLMCYSYESESFCETLENSLIKHANTIKYFKTTKRPSTNILSYFINLRVLELDSFHYMPWNCLENLSLPFLKILKVKHVLTDNLTGLIENTSGTLIEISITWRICHSKINYKKIIQAIYQNCPNLKYLKLVIKKKNIIDLEKLLIQCQYLEGLYLVIEDKVDEFNLNNLFKVLANSSPTNLFKFKFSFFEIKFSSLKLFLDNWKGRHPMLLQFGSDQLDEIKDLIEEYKSEGIIKNCDYNFHDEEFEWSN